jgi:hypothetical protein
MLRHRYQTQWYGSDGKLVDGPSPDCETIVTICETCDEVLLYDGIAEDEVDARPQLQWPRDIRLDKAVPSVVAHVYEEASKIKHVAPNAFAVMIRRALEALCEDRGVGSGSLAKRLESLASRGEIPQLLAEMSDTLRTLGNIGAHASSDSVTAPQTWAMDDFFRAVVEYVYVAPSKLAEFKGQLKQLKAVDNTP